MHSFKCAVSLMIIGDCGSVTCLDLGTRNNQVLLSVWLIQALVSSVHFATLNQPLPGSTNIIMRRIVSLIFWSRTLQDRTRSIHTISQEITSMFLGASFLCFFVFFLNLCQCGHCFTYCLISLSIYSQQMVDVTVSTSHKFCSCK